MRILIFNLLLLFPMLTLAANGCDDNGAFSNPLGYCTIEELLRSVLSAVVTIAFPFIVLFLVYAGFLFVSAQGNEEKLATAKKVFMWTIIGGLLILGAEVLSIAIEGTIQDISDF